MKTYMFPGQGSQSKGMGGELFDECSKMTNIADQILGYSIKKLCLEDPKGELGQTQFTQPAIFVVNALSYFKKVEESGQKPDYAIGHSLGEFNALLAAECFDFEAGLKMVKKRGELMSQAVGGAMAAILNATKEEIESILKDNGLSGIDLANFNTPNQTVISGLRDEIIKAEKFFLKGNMQYIPLSTSGAFHSRYMQPAKEEFETYMKEFNFSNLKIPVLSNVTARPYKNDETTVHLSNQITNSVRWCESIQYLMGLGEMTFEEIGYGAVLTKMIQKIKEQSPTLSKHNGEETEKNEVKQTSVTQEQKREDNRAGSIDTDKNEEAKPLTADEKVAAWNKKYSVGTRVKSTIMDDGNLETRTKAVVLFGHRAAVYMKDYNGYFDLDEVKVL